MNLKRVSDIIFGKNFSIIFFIGFVIVSVYYFAANFIFFFLNKEYNADEDYQNTLYSLSNFSFHKFFYTNSQPYVFISSVVDTFVKAPKYSTRLASLLLCIGLVIYFVKKISTLQSTMLEKIYKNALLICAIFITSQMFMGTSDFLSYVLLVVPFLILLESIDSGKINLTNKKSFIIGLLLALSIATRPTAIILIALFYGSVFLILGFKSIFCKENYIIFISGLSIFFLMNFLPIVQQHRVVLDVKEVPKETGVTWFQRNYLMAKFWDSKQIPKTQWVSTQDVIKYKKENPNFVFPKNQIDLLIKEPGLYFRQMLRMVGTATYTSFRFMCLLFPLLLVCFLKSKRFKTVRTINDTNPKDVVKNKIIIGFYFISIVVFSFIAVKMFEFRWIVPIMILYVYYAIVYLSRFPEKFRFMIYTLSFLSGIILYSISFIKTIL